MLKHNFKRKRYKVLSVQTNKLSPLTINLRLFIFKTYIRPIINYEGTAWTANISRTSWSKFEALQSTSLNQITGLDLYVPQDTIRSKFKILTLKE